MKPLKRWGVGVVGQYSGTKTELTFVRFYRRQKAEDWIERRNRAVAKDSNTGELAKFVLIDRWKDDPWDVQGLGPDAAIQAITLEFRAKHGDVEP